MSPRHAKPRVVPACVGASDLFPSRGEAMWFARHWAPPGRPDGRGSKIQERCFWPWGPWAMKAKLSPCEPLFFACARALQERRRTANPPEGRGTGMCRVKKSNPKKRFTAAERLIKHPPPARPRLCCGSAEPAGFFDATRPPCSRALGIRRAANAPGRSGASPFSGEPMCVAPAGFFPPAPPLQRGHVAVTFVGRGGWRAVARGGVARSRTKSRATATATA